MYLIIIKIIKNILNINDNKHNLYLNNSDLLIMSSDLDDELLNNNKKKCINYLKVFIMHEI